MRHADFERIKREFDNYYCKGSSCSKGETEYYAWLTALRLDETLPYGSAHESFRWAKDMISLLKEDAENKYYRILIGFPLRSMNGNPYKERDLIAAAMTLKGRHPSLNHKDEFWFNETNPYGCLTTVDAKYEDGAVEAILKVPRTAECPICNHEKMTHLIDNHRIVNVSLEGQCLGDGGPGRCDGFVFGEKGFSLLTSDVLPGIPLARVFPMESFLPMYKKHMRVKIVGLGESNMKKKEDATLTGLPEEAPPTVKPDTNNQCPTGYLYDGKLNLCVKQEPQPEHVTHLPEGTAVITSTQVAPRANLPDETVTPKSSFPDTSGQAQIQGEAKEFDTFDDCKTAMMSQGYDEESAGAICNTICGKGGEQVLQSANNIQLSDALLKKAEADAKLNEFILQHNAIVTGLKATVEQRTKLYNIERAARLFLQGRAEDLRKEKLKYEARMERWNTERNELEVKLKTERNELATRLQSREKDLTEALESMKTYKDQLEATQKENLSLNAKYKETLSTNLALNRQITKNNEEWLKGEKDREELEERLKTAKRLAKKISIKI